MSWSRLGVSWMCPAASWVHLRAFWERLGKRPGRVLGSLWDVLREFRAPLREPSGVLGYLGASWERLGIGLRNRREVDGEHFILNAIF